MAFNRKNAVQSACRPQAQLIRKECSISISLVSAFDNNTRGDLGYTMCNHERFKIFFLRTM